MNFKDVLKFGVFYNPANKHYGLRGVVNCDKCKRTDIPTAVGYNNIDLCLSCCSSVEKQMYRSVDVFPELKAKMHQYQYVTNMHQAQYNVNQSFK